MGLEILETTEQSNLRIDEMAESSWVERHHQVNAGILHSVEVKYSRNKPKPEEPDEPETWEVGYIANVLWETVDATYGQARTRKSFTFGGPILDKLEAGGATAWYSNQPTVWQNMLQRPIQVFKEFPYGGGISESRDGALVARLEFVDFPRRSYLNEFQGVRGGDQLRKLDDQIMFGLWVAARRKSDSPLQVGSYTVLFAKSILLPISLRIKGGDFWPWEGRQEGAKGPFLYPKAMPREVAWVSRYKGPGQKRRTSIESVQPTVSGPTANDVLSQQLINSGICG